MPITRFLPPHRAFDPEAIKAIRVAYVRALSATGSVGEQRTVQEILAKHIVKAAAAGESEPDRLCDDALASLDLKR